MEAVLDPDYDLIDGGEQIGMYVPGGYHPVELGDLLHGRYRIMEKLGFGVIPPSGLLETPSRSDLSVAPSPDHPGRKSVPMLLDEFKIEGPNGNHTCYATLPAQGNLRDISSGRLFTLEVARALSAGLAQALAYTHSRGYVHGGFMLHLDLHLGNVLVPLPASFQQLSMEEFLEEYGAPETARVTRRDGKEIPPNVPTEVALPLLMGKKAQEMVVSEARVILNDFGEAYAPASEVRLGRHCHTPLAFRPPEARLEPDTPLSCAADIWSLATAIWDIVGMEPVFFALYATPDDVTAQYIDILGPMPKAWWDSWRGRFRYFDDQGLSKEKRDLPRGPLDQEFELCIQKHREELNMAKFDGEETAAILSLMRRMLAFRPEERPTCEEVLKSEWMVEWALPELRRAEKESQINSS
ncbi:kinase-like domain-containing protein [Coprinopsis sp. MPI-PUGE-AT-0042]|nr:kinase-like domain-containing protein [Coprinopsis sp. MPI-PUGE-AT-0042]